MENVCRRFPHLANRIFDQVDNKSLNNCKEISRDVLEHLNNERFFWIRIIKKYRGPTRFRGRLKDFQEVWKPVIEKAPVEIVKQIAIAVSRFFEVNRDHLYYDYTDKHSTRTWPLIIISANHGDLALLQSIVNKIQLKNVKKSERIIALLIAAFNGDLKIYKFLSGKLRDKNPRNTSHTGSYPVT